MHSFRGRSPGARSLAWGSVCQGALRCSCRWQPPPPPDQPGSHRRRDEVRKSCGNPDESQQDKAKAFPGRGVASHKCWRTETCRVGQGCRGARGATAREGGTRVPQAACRTRTGRHVGDKNLARHPERRSSGCFLPVHLRPKRKSAVLVKPEPGFSQHHSSTRAGSFRAAVASGPGELCR